MNENETIVNDTLVPIDYEKNKIPDTWKKIKLADGTIFNVVEYENEQMWDTIKLVLGFATYTEVTEAFTKENCSDITLISNINDEVIAELFNKKLGNEVTLNTDVEQITIHLENYELEDRVISLTEQLEQARADIDYVTVMTGNEEDDVDEESASEETE